MKQMTLEEQEKYEAAIDVLIEKMRDNGFTSLQIADKLISGDLSMENANAKISGIPRCQLDLFNA